MEPNQPTASDQRLYTAAQVRALDRTAIEDHDIPGMTLMERAGRATFDAARDQFPGHGRWLVACGGGNNGGDGYVIARLAREAGIDCRVAALKTPEQLRGDAGTAAKLWLDAGGTVELGPPRDLDDFDLVFDALLGTGLDRPPEGEYADAISSLNTCAARVVAVDVPSGLNADSGRAIGGLAVRADLTVTFVGRKLGLYTADGPDHAGRVVYTALGIPEGIFQASDNTGILIYESVIKNALGRRSRNSHKGDFGWVLGIGGDQGMSGAMRLCGEAALRTGAGKVTLLTHADHAATINANRPELMVRAVGDVAVVGELLHAADVIVLGPGLGQSDWSRTLLRAGLGHKRPRVLDADALNLLAGEGGLDLIAPGGESAVITPHPAEAGRLLGSDARAVQDDRVGAATALTERTKAVVVLKGCGTVVAGPDSRLAICPLGNPGMATAGSGDVLAGVIGAMLAQGLDAWQAATVGVVAHSAAGDCAAKAIGERGLIASDITARLPGVLNPD